MGFSFCFCNEAIDCGLEIDEGVEDATVKPSPSEFGEESFDGVGPRTGCRGEVKHKPLVALEPGPDLWVLKGGIVVENDMDGLVFRNLSIDHVEEADKFLVPVALHIAPDHGPVEDVQGCEEGRGSIAACSRGSWCRDAPSSWASQAGCGPAPGSGFSHRQTERWRGREDRRKAQRHRAICQRS